MTARRPAVSDPIPLDPASENILSWERPGFPQTDFVGFTLRGPVDDAALREAVREAQEARPHFHAFLRPRWRGARREWAWNVDGEPCPLEVVGWDAGERAPEDVDAWLHGAMRDETGRIKDLGREYPARFRLYRLPGRTSCLVLSFHHVAADGAAAWDCFRDVFSAYHRRVAGARPAWEGVPAFHSLLAEPAATSAPTPREFLRLLRAERKRFPPGRTAQILGTPGGAPGRLMIRRVIDDPVELRALRDRARHARGSLSDLFVAGSMMALDEWNTGRGAPPTVMVHGLAVSQRRRRAADGRFRGNPVSMVSVPSARADRATPEAALRHAVATRQGKLAAGHDVALIEAAHRFHALVGWMPLSLRGRLQRAAIVRPLSLFITNPGVLWPAAAGGRPTGETALVRAGDAELTDIHLSVGGTPTNPMAMILKTFRGRLHVSCTVGRHRLREQEARAHADLIYRKVLDFL